MLLTPAIADDRSLYLKPAPARRQAAHGRTISRVSKPSDARMRSLGFAGQPIGSSSGWTASSPEMVITALLRAGWTYARNRAVLPPVSATGSAFAAPLGVTRTIAATSSVEARVLPCRPRIRPPQMGAAGA